MTHSSAKEEAAEESDDEDISSDSDKKKKPKESTSSTKSISILTRSTSEFDTCTNDKPVEFDPVQGRIRSLFFYPFVRWIDESSTSIL